GRNVEEDEFISALLIIELSCFHRVARITEIKEVDTLHNPTIFDIKAGNDAFGEHAFLLLLHCGTRLRIGETPLVQGLADEHSAHSKRLECRQLPKIYQLRDTT